MNKHFNLKRISTSVFCFLLIALMVFPSYAFTGTQSSGLREGTGYIEIHNDADAYVAPDPLEPACADASQSYYLSSNDGYATRVKNQGDYGTCWAFSAMSTAESSLLAQHRTINGGNSIDCSTLDFSESHFACFFWNLQTDPLGLTEGDRNIGKVADSDYLTRGGNNYLSSFCIANWFGTCLESKCPYPKVTDASLMWDTSAHCQNYYYIDMSDIQTVKKMIVKYGSIQVSYQHSMLYANYSTYGGGKPGYYCDDKNVSGYGHSVAIIGWDDTFANNNKNYGDTHPKPPAAGAWIVKNSWGTSSYFGEKGLFYLSYYDRPLTYQAEGVVYDYEDNDNYDNNYHYDGSSAFDTLTIPASKDDPTRLAQQFTVKASDYESLEAVSFTLNTTNVNYSIQIYKKDSMSTAPDQGTPMLDTPVTGKTKYLGYYTVPLNKSLVFEKGDIYSIVISVWHESGSLEVYCEKVDHDNSWVWFESTAHPYESWFAFGQDAAFADLSTYTCDEYKGYNQGYTLRIKGFTDNVAPVEYDLTSLTSTTEKPARLGYDFEFTLTPDLGLNLPSEIEFYRNGKLLTNGDQYTYDNTTGKVVYNKTVKSDDSFKVVAMADSYCDHKYVESLVTPATCDTDGVTKYECSLCGFKYTKNLPEAFGHTETTKTFDATCAKVGYTQTSCSVCGNVSAKQTGEALGHTWSAWTTTKAPTTTTYGEKFRICTVCDTKDYSYIRSNDDKTQHVVTFDANGGIDAPAPQIKTYGPILTLTEDIPKRPGYTFLGWGKTATDKSPTYYPGKLYGTDKDITMYAVWEENGLSSKKFKITLDPNGGTLVKPCSYTMKEGQFFYTVVNEMPGAVNGSRELLGWYNEKYDMYLDNSDTNYLEQKENLVFKAVWGEATNAKIVTMNSTANGTLSVVTENGEALTGSLAKVEPGTVITITATPDSHSNFGSLKVNGEDFTSGETFTVNDNTTISAEFVFDETKHDYKVVTEVKAKCTTVGYKDLKCSCGATQHEDYEALGHNWTAWRTVKEATETEPGSKERFCIKCYANETAEIPIIAKEITATTENYTVLIVNATDATAIRIVPGNYTTASAIKNAPGMIGYGADSIAKATTDGIIRLPLKAEGVNSIWVKTSSIEKILQVDANSFTPTASTNDLTLTVNNTSSQIASMFIARGNYSAYRDVKNNLITSLTSSKIGTAQSYSYKIPSNYLDTDGSTDITVLVRGTNGEDSYLHTTVTTPAPTVTQNGLDITIDSLTGVKCIKRAFGTYSTLTALKAASGVITYGSTVASGADSAKLHIPHEGTLTVAVQYKNGYTRIFNLEIVQKRPTFVQDGNKVTIGNIDDLYIVRYAKGTYTKANTIKVAPGSLIIRPSAAVEGKIVVNNLAKGTYTFLVQYNDQSQNIYTITVS